MDEREPHGKQNPRIHWQRFAILASAVITTVAIIRLAADAAGIPRGTRASVLVSAASNAVMILMLGIAAPHAQVGIPFAPLRRRMKAIVPLALASAVINYLILIDEL